MTYEQQGPKEYATGTIIQYEPPRQDNPPESFLLAPSDGSENIYIAIGNEYQSDERPDWAQRIASKLGGYQNLVNQVVKTVIKENPKYPTKRDTFGNNLPSYYAQGMELLGEGVAPVTVAESTPPPMVQAVPSNTPSAPKIDGMKDCNRINASVELIKEAMKLSEAKTPSGYMEEAVGLLKGSHTYLYNITPNEDEDLF